MWLALILTPFAMAFFAHIVDQPSLSSIKQDLRTLLGPRKPPAAQDPLHPAAAPEPPNQSMPPHTYILTASNKVVPTGADMAQAAAFPRLPSPRKDADLEQPQLDSPGFAAFQQGAVPTQATSGLAHGGDSASAAQAMGGKEGPTAGAPGGGPVAESQEGEGEGERPSAVRPAGQGLGQQNSRRLVRLGSWTTR